MTGGTNDAHGPRGQSELDRKAIVTFGHMLMTGIWLERQLKRAPGFHLLLEESRSFLSPGRLFGLGVSRDHQSTNHEP